MTLFSHGVTSVLLNRYEREHLRQRATGFVQGLINIGDIQPDRYGRITAGMFQGYDDGMRGFRLAVACYAGGTITHFKEG